MPPYYIGVIGELSIPRDEDKSIIKEMKKGTPLTESDVLVIKNRSLYEYMLLSHNTKLDTRPWIRHWRTIINHVTTC